MLTPKVVRQCPEGPHTYSRGKETRPRMEKEKEPKTQSKKRQLGRPAMNTMPGAKIENIAQSLPIMLE